MLAKHKHTNIPTMTEGFPPSRRRDPCLKLPARQEVPSMCQHCESKVIGQTRWTCTDGDRHCSKKCMLDNGCELSDERIAKNVSSEIMLLTLNLFVSLLLTFFSLAPTEAAEIQLQSQEPYQEILETRGDEKGRKQQAEGTRR